MRIRAERTKQAASRQTIEKLSVRAVVGSPLFQSARGRQRRSASLGVQGPKSSRQGAQAERAGTIRAAKTNWQGAQGRFGESKRAGRALRGDSGSQIEPARALAGSIGWLIEQADRETRFWLARSAGSIEQPDQETRFWLARSAGSIGARL